MIDLEIGLVVLPLAAQVSRLELFEIGVEVLDSFCEGQKRMIEREAVSVPLGFPL